MISTALQKKLDELVPKKDQNQFVENAVLEKLSTLNQLKEKSPSGSCIKLYTDGGSRGNPGPAGGGFLIYKNNAVAKKGSEFFGVKTNNQSEYLALRSGLREVYEQFPNDHLECYLDSELIVKQMKGEYKVKSDKVKPLYEEVKRIADQFKGFQIFHIPRAQNRLADQLANEAMDRGQ